MPSRRPSAGRHRRPKGSGAPAYLTAATLAAFAVGGLNVPDAIGASGSPNVEPVSSTTDGKHGLSAAELRARVALQQAARSTRLRAARAEADHLAGAAKAAAEKRAREAAEKARPKWVKPLLNYGMSAGYGQASYLWSSVHTGQDFTAPSGTPVRVVGDGTIISAGWDGSYGQKIVVLHPNGTETWYAHLSSFVRTGGTVKAGDVIGRVGSTGNATGPHLHFEVRPGGGGPIEPVAWLRAHGVRV